MRARVRVLPYLPCLLGGGRVRVKVRVRGRGSGSGRVAVRVRATEACSYGHTSHDCEGGGG